MNRTKPLDPQEAVAIVAKRRLQARRYYSRMREDARRYREAQQQKGQATSVADQHRSTK